MNMKKHAEPIRAGDVVVFTHEIYPSTIGRLGIVQSESFPGLLEFEEWEWIGVRVNDNYRSEVGKVGKEDPIWTVRKDWVEVIDHDLSLLKEPSPIRPGDLVVIHANVPANNYPIWVNEIYGDLGVVVSKGINGGNRHLVDVGNEHRVMPDESSTLKVYNYKILNYAAGEYSVYEVEQK